VLPLGDVGGGSSLFRVMPSVIPDWDPAGRQGGGTSSAGVACGRRWAPPAGAGSSEPTFPISKDRIPTPSFQTWPHTPEGHTESGRRKLGPEGVSKEPFGGDNRE
jgi:hypothetical protein